jgi:hypothetical protein
VSFKSVDSRISSKVVVDEVINPLISGWLLIESG